MFCTGKYRYLPSFDQTPQNSPKNHPKAATAVRNLHFPLPDHKNLLSETDRKSRLRIIFNIAPAPAVAPGAAL